MRRSTENDRSPLALVQGIQAKILKLIRTLGKVAFNGELDNFFNGLLWTIYT